MTPRQPLLTTDDVAEECQVTAETVRNWARGNHLKGISLPGGQWRFRREDVDEFIAGPKPVEPVTA